MTAISSTLHRGGEREEGEGEGECESEGGG